jgi:hypothetical protein
MVLKEVLYRSYPQNLICQLYIRLYRWGRGGKLCLEKLQEEAQEAEKENHSWFSFSQIASFWSSSSSQTGG